jgi:hypothetical protein
MNDGFGGASRTIPLTLFTDAFTVRGRLETRHRRLTDALNEATDGFIVLSDVTFDEFRSASNLIRADYGQINLSSVLFVTSDADVDADPSLATPRVSEEALISVPPFRILGRIHLEAGRSLRDALGELRGRFVPVTQATHWSDALAEARTTVSFLAVNHARCQILAPHQEVDPWAGLGSPAVEAGGGWDEPSPPSEPPSASEPTGW